MCLLVLARLTWYSFMPSCSLLSTQLSSSDDTVAALGVTEDSNSSVSGTCITDRHEVPELRAASDHPALLASFFLTTCPNKQGAATEHDALVPHSPPLPTCILLLLWPLPSLFRPEAHQVAHAGQRLKLIGSRTCGGGLVIDSGTHWAHQHTSLLLLDLAGTAHRLLLSAQGHGVVTV